MMTLQCKPGRGASVRRLVLLAAAANLAVAALLIGPDGFRQSVLPTFPAANAAEGASSLGRGWIGVQIQPVTSAIAESLGMMQRRVGCGTADR
jgi:S1-C subfamily serine protease